MLKWTNDGNRHSAHGKRGEWVIERDRLNYVVFLNGEKHGVSFTLGFAMDYVEDLDEREAEGAAR